MTTLPTRASIAGLLLLVAVATAALPAALAQPKEPSAVEAWVAAPAAGATSAAAYVEVNNPTMYEMFIVKATADGVAGKVELRGAASAGDPPAVTEFPVPAYGSTSASLFSEAKALAVTAAIRFDGISTPVPSRIFVVFSAAAAIATNGSADSIWVS